MELGREGGYVCFSLCEPSRRSPSSSNTRSSHPQANPKHDSTTPKQCRERARLPLASVTQARLVLTNWETLCARDAVLGAESAMGAWLGTSRQQRNGRREAATATAEVAVGSRLMQLGWKRVVVDEAQRLSKGPVQRGKCAEALGKLRAEHRWLVMDGTGLLGRKEGKGKEWGPREDERARAVMAALFGEDDEEEVEEDGEGAMARSHQAVGVFRLLSTAVTL